MTVIGAKMPPNRGRNDFFRVAQSLLLLSLLLFKRVDSFFFSADLGVGVYNHDNCAIITHVHFVHSLIHNRVVR